MNNQELKRLRELAGTATVSPKPEYIAPKSVQQIMENYVPVQEASTHQIDEISADTVNSYRDKATKERNKAKDGAEYDRGGAEKYRQFAKDPVGPDPYGYGNKYRKKSNALKRKAREKEKTVAKRDRGLDMANRRPDVNETNQSAPTGSIESYIDTPEAGDVPVTVYYDVAMAEPDVNFGGEIHLHAEDANGNEVEISSADQYRFEQEINDDLMSAMDEYGDYKMQQRQDDTMESSDEDSEIARMSALAGLDTAPKKKVSVKRAPWDKEIAEDSDDRIDGYDILRMALQHRIITPNEYRNASPEVEEIAHWVADRNSDLGSEISASDISIVMKDFCSDMEASGQYCGGDEAHLYEASDEDEQSQHRALANADRGSKKKVSVKKAPWDKEIAEDSTHKIDEISADTVNSYRDRAAKERNKAKDGAEYDREGAEKYRQFAKDPVGPDPYGYGNKYRKKSNALKRAAREKEKTVAKRDRGLDMANRRPDVKEIAEADNSQAYIWYDIMSLPDDYALFDELDDLLGHDPVPGNSRQGPAPEDYGLSEFHIAVSIDNTDAIEFLDQHGGQVVEIPESSLAEAVAKIACLECDEVSTAKAWQKNNDFCPKCNNSTRGVAESEEFNEASDEDSEIARMSALAGLNNAPKKKVSVKKAPWDKEIDEAGKAMMTQDNIAKKVAAKLNPDAHRYNQITAIKRILSSSDDQKILATDREFIDDVLDILYDKYNFRAVNEAKKPDADGDGIPDWADDKDETELSEGITDAKSLGKSAHKDHKRAPTSDPRLMHLMNKDGMRGADSFDQRPYLDAWLAGYDSMVKNESQQMREWANSVYQQYDDKGHVMSQPEGETVDLSLRRYINATPGKVTVAENNITAKSLTESYNKFKRSRGKA
jgi:hypothetical protein